MFADAKRLPDREDAELDVLRGQANSLLAAEGWPLLERSIRHHIGMLSDALEKSAENDEQIRGMLKAYRGVLDFPAAVISKATKGS